MFYKITPDPQDQDEDQDRILWSQTGLVLRRTVVTGFCNTMNLFSKLKGSKRGHPYKLFLTRCFTDVRKYFFCNRVVKYGMNCLVTLILHVLILLSADLLVLI